jgi:hypothetical protein
MRIRRWRRLAAGSIICSTLAGAVLLMAPPAAANVTQGPCTGFAIIAGKKYTPANDTVSNPVHVPRTGLVQYHGDTGSTVTAPHHGHLAIQVGPSKITIYSWASPNENHKIADDGTQDLKKAYDKLPFGIAGIYKIYGYHYNSGALFCTGFAYVKFDQSPLSTPIGLAAVILTALAALAVIGAARGAKVAYVGAGTTSAGSGRGRKPILGALGGLFLGAFVAIDLQQFSLRPLDNLSVIGLPVIGLVLGLVLGLTVPLGGGPAHVAGGGAAPPPAAPSPPEQPSAS